MIYSSQWFFTYNNWRCSCSRQVVKKINIVFLLFVYNSLKCRQTEFNCYPSFFTPNIYVMVVSVYFIYIYFLLQFCYLFFLIWIICGFNVYKSFPYDAWLFLKIDLTYFYFCRNVLSIQDSWSHYVKSWSRSTSAAGYPWIKAIDYDAYGKWRIAVFLGESISTGIILFF